MVLTAENYYSQEANEEYMSVSQFKDFCGTYGKMPCEFTAMEKLKGRWEEPKSKALMVGSYVDSYFEGTLDKFKAENPDLFKRDGTLKAEFVKADEIIQRIERDDYFMKFMSGKKQVIMTGELFGTKWKAVREKWCCTCEYYIPVDPWLPGFVTAYPECEKGRNPVQTCEDYRTAGCAIRNSPWADRIRERFMRKE